MATGFIDAQEIGNGSGPVTLTKQSAAKAWANLNGTGTIAGRDSLNISSYDDNGTGNYDYNFSTSFAAADYASFAGTPNSAAFATGGTSGIAAGSWNTQVFGYNGASLVDVDHVSFSAHGDLA